jgi:hypothetical protein
VIMGDEIDSESCLIVGVGVMDFFFVGEFIICKLFIVGSKI